MPEGSAPSPITATEWRDGSPIRSSPALRPSAADTEAAGVPGHEQVVVALGGVGIAHQPAARADAVELGIAAGEQLVRVDLVAGVPDEAVAAEVELQMQGQGQLDHAEVAGEVGGPQGQAPGPARRAVPGPVARAGRRPGRADPSATRSEAGWGSWQRSLVVAWAAPAHSAVSGQHERHQLAQPPCPVAQRRKQAQRPPVPGRRPWPGSPGTPSNPG